MLQSAWFKTCVCVAIIFSQLSADLALAGNSFHDASSESSAQDDSPRLAQQPRVAMAHHRAKHQMDDSREAALTLVILGDFKRTIESLHPDHVDESMEQFKGFLLKLSQLAQTCKSLEKNCARLRALLISPLSQATAISPEPVSLFMTRERSCPFIYSALVISFLGVVGSGGGFIGCEIRDSSGSDCSPLLYASISSIPFFAGTLVVVANSKRLATKIASWRNRRNQNDAEQWRHDLNDWFNTDIEARLSPRDFGFQDIMDAVNRADQSQIVGILDLGREDIIQALHEIREFDSIPFPDT